MSRKLLICAFMAALVYSANAAPFVFGSFEDANDGYRDWGDQSVYLQPPKYTYVTTGATLGSKAVCMDTNAAGWEQNLSIKSYESPYAGYPNALIQALVDGSVELAMDVTYVKSDWSREDSEGGYATIELNIQGTGIEWTGLGRPDEDTGNPGYAGGWDYLNFGDVHTRTMIWDLSEFFNGDYTDAGEFTGSPGDGYVNFIWQTSVDSGFTDGGVFYIDNIRLVPEPATMILLGLGGLALRRRKH